MLVEACKLGLVGVDVLFYTAVDRQHIWHILARQKSNLQRKRNSIEVVVVVAVNSPLNIVSSASLTVVAAASTSSLIIVLLLGPAALRQAPQFYTVRALARFALATESLHRVFSLHGRCLSSCLLICFFLGDLMAFRDCRLALLDSKLNTTFS